MVILEIHKDFNIDLIRQHHTLENVSRVKDISFMNYPAVRKIFMCTIVKSPITELNFDRNKCKTNAKSILTTY